MTNRNIRNRMFHQHLIKICFLTLICLVFVGCENKDYIYSSEHGTEQISNRPTETSEATVSPTATTSPTPTASPTPTTSPTPTASPAPTASPTPATKPQPVAAGTKIENNIYYAKSGNTASFPDFSGLAFIISDSDGTVLMSKNQNMTIYPASTMKMLTALTALDYLSMDTVITATADMLVKTGNYYEYGVVPGTSYTLSTWIHILMMNSAGDAANIIAHAAGKVIAGNDSGGIAEFVVAMNKKAKSLGMNDTCVDNAVGIDIGDNYTNMYTTAEDMTKLARAYMNVEALAEVVKKENYVVPNCEKQAGKTIYSTNYFLIKKTEFASDYFYSIGTKSGQTNAAGHCFVATVIAKDGRQLTCACYGLDQGENSRWILFYQMRALLEYCIKNEK